MSDAGPDVPTAHGGFESRPLTVTGDETTVRFDALGLVPVVVIDASDGAVLMLAYANREALRLTLDTGQAYYYSRSRRELWRKGATSGHVQQVVEVVMDCDGDSLMYRVKQTGPACHTGERSCFHRGLAAGAGAPEARASGAGGVASATASPATDDLDGMSGEPASPGEVLELLERVVAERLATLPEGSYVRRLHERGIGYVAQKVIEEAGETVVAALEHKDTELHGEAADLLFHLSVLLAERGVAWSDVAGVLLARHATSAKP